MGWSRNDEDFRADHYRDHAKQEPRPGDRDFPIRLETSPLSGAMTVAILVKGLPNVTDAASLIEQYAQTVASEARLQATIDTSDRIMGVIDALNGKVSA